MAVAHVPGEQLVLADALSRRYVDPAMNDTAEWIILQMGLFRTKVVSLETLFDDEQKYGSRSSSGKCRLDMER